MNILYRPDIIPTPDHIRDERSHRIHRDFCGFYDSCIRAIAETGPDATVTIYRARESANARTASVALIGTTPS